MVKCSLVDDNLNLASFTNLQRSLNQPWNLLKFHHAGFAENGLCPNLGDLVDHLLSPGLATFRDIVDNDISASLGQLESNPSTDTPGKTLAVCAGEENACNLPRGTRHDRSLALQGDAGKVGHVDR